MSLFSILETLLIGPLKLVFEIIFGVANSFVGHPGIAIIFLSLVMNILVLPLYRRADAMQEAARDIDNKLHDGVAHIKKTFSGDERMMILQAYYRQNNYKPTDALHGSVSLFLEIPFFMAAYHFLSHLEILDGVSLGPIKDLSAPDGLIVIGDVAINLLPIIMTLVNIISSAIYLKGFPMKTKVQLYAMAIFFLVFLYTSPSGLVFYWTLNNVFSFGKNIFYKIKNPQKVLGILTAIIGVAVIIYGGFVYDTTSIKRRVFLIGIGIVLLLPILTPLFKKLIKPTDKKLEPNKKIFVLGGVFLTVLTGLLIPTTYIAASPQEYVDVSYFHNPLWYVVSCVCFAAGFFFIWFRVFYWLASDGFKVIFEKLIWIMSLIMIVNYMFFGTDLGNISSTLKYDNGMAFTINEQLINILVIVVIALVALFCIKKSKKVVSSVLIIAIIALGGMSVLNIGTINSSIDNISTETIESGEMPNFNLSKNGKNVVVIMLDRAVGEYTPYIMNERPELKEKFDGFTYYSNVISYGKYTNFGIPALYGGYEYTPVELNKRDTELLVEKHNEAIKVLPVLFENNNYEVTVCDPVYANYQWVPDLSIYDEYEGIDAYITNGMFSDVEQKDTIIQNNYRNFFCFSIMKSMPVFIQPTIYNNGEYCKIDSNSSNVEYTTQIADTMSTAKGLHKVFMDAYNALASMSSMTQITEDGDTFMIMSNVVTHEPALLSEPDYTPAAVIDNTEFDANNSDRFILDGKELKIDTAYQMSHYQSNMAAYLQLAKWFDYLRENDVYDNTKIIIVADHAHGFHHLDDLIVDNSGEKVDLGHFFPLLLVKDFDSTGFNTSKEFMTNADVPTLATDGVIDNPVNPFTQNPINSNEKTAHDQFISMSSEYQTNENNGYTFFPSRWVSVKDDIWNKNNWTFYNEKTVLKEHTAP